MSEATMLRVMTRLKTAFTEVSPWVRCNLVAGPLEPLTMSW
jgi:hypothetical protein